MVNDNKMTPTPRRLAESEIREVLEVLKPFAALAEEYDYLTEYCGEYCKMSDLRRAAALLSDLGEREAEAIGETSDGYHTFNELYAHRIALFIALMKSHVDISWRSRKHDDGSMFDGWFIAGMNLPTGVVTYHLPDSDWRKLDPIVIYDAAPKWDGHTPADVVDRVERWILTPPPPPAGDAK